METHPYMNLKGKIFATIIVFFKIFLSILLLLSLVLFVPVVVVSYLVSFVSKSFSVKIATICSFICWKLFNLIFSLTSKINYSEIPEGDYLVISNHISAVDFVLINHVNQHRFSNSKYVFKKDLKFIPVFYQACLLLKFLVVARNFQQDFNKIISYIKEIKENKYPIWFVLFPEGSRFTETKKASSVKFCQKRGIAPFSNVLAPRYKGFDLIQRNLANSYINKILDLTFYCQEEDFSFFNLLFTAKRFNFICDHRICFFDQIHDPAKFLDDSFRRKDKLIEEWKNKFYE